MPLCVRNWKGDAVLVSPRNTVIRGVGPVARTAATTLWETVIAFIVEHRILPRTQVRQLGDLCRAAYLGHVSRWEVRVIAYATWLRLGGGILPALERTRDEPLPVD